MPALAQSFDEDLQNRAANDDDINGGSGTRTKYAYDANGNATSRQGSGINWASYNYPTSVSAGSGSTAETVSFVYGPDRSRWQQNYTGNGSTETTDYIGGLLNLVTSAGVSDYRHYIYAGNEPVAVYSRKSTGANTFSYLLSDHEGSVASITNSSGVVDVSESFMPFGNRRNPATWSGAASTVDLTTAAGLTRQGYTFQTQLGLWMGLNHMNGRAQDSITGRILSADPYIPDPTDPQSYNRYSYVRNNPLTLTDPSGFCDAHDMSDCEQVAVTADGCDQWCRFLQQQAVLNALRQLQAFLDALLQENEQGAAGGSLGGGLDGLGVPGVTADIVPQTDPNVPCFSAQGKALVSGTDILGAVSGLNDTATTIATVASEAGGSVSGLAGRIVKVSPYIAAPLNAGILLHGYRTSNSDEMFDGSYGLGTIGVAFLNPPLALGMALAKVISDVSTPKPPSILDQAATLPTLAPPICHAPSK